MNAYIGAAGIAAAGADGIVLDTVFREQTDARADTVAVALRSYGPDEQPVIGGRADVVKDSQWPIEFRKNHVDAAIVVQVTKGSTAVHASPGKRPTGLGGDVRELLIAQIREDNVGLRYGGAQTAFGIHHVAADGKEILAAVVIEVVKHVAPPGLRQRGVRHAAREGDFLEAHLTQIAKQRHGLIEQCRLEDVREAIVV